MPRARRRTRRRSRSRRPHPIRSWRAPCSTMRYPRAAAVTLRIFDLQGRVVRTLAGRRDPAGRRVQCDWDGRDGRQVARPARASTSARLASEGRHRYAHGDARAVTPGASGRSSRVHIGAVRRSMRSGFLPQAAPTGSLARCCLRRFRSTLTARSAATSRRSARDGGDRGVPRAAARRARARFRAPKSSGALPPLLPAESVLLHADLTADNILVHDGQLAGFIEASRMPSWAPWTYELAATSCFVTQGRSTFAARALAFGPAVSGDARALSSRCAAGPCSTASATSRS